MRDRGFASLRRSFERSHAMSHPVGSRPYSIDVLNTSDNTIGNSSLDYHLLISHASADYQQFGCYCDWMPFNVGAGLLDRA